MGHGDEKAAIPLLSLFIVRFSHFNSLDSNQITDAGAEALADALRVNATLAKLE